MRFTAWGRFIFPAQAAVLRGLALPEMSSQTPFSAKQTGSRRPRDQAEAREPGGPTTFSKR